MHPLPVACKECAEIGIVTITGEKYTTRTTPQCLFCPPSVARWAEVGEGGSGGKLKLRQKVGAVGNR